MEQSKENEISQNQTRKNEEIKQADKKENDKMPNTTQRENKPWYSYLNPFNFWPSKETTIPINYLGSVHPIFRQSESKIGIDNNQPYVDLKVKVGPKLMQAEEKNKALLEPNK